MPVGKILNHPDREEIIKRLLDGETTEKVQNWLKGLYPNNKELQVTGRSIADFRKNHLNIDIEAARIIRGEKQRKELNIPSQQIFTELSNISQEQHALRVKENLLSSPTYRQKLLDITDAHLDAPRLIKELQVLLSSRLEAYYNEISLNTSTSESIKADKMFAEYARLVLDILRDSKKIWDDYNTTTDEGTVNLNVVHEQVGMIRDIVKDLLNELDPMLALDFMDKLNTRVSAAKYKPNEQPSIIDQVDKLTKRIKKIQVGDEQNS